ncbi:MAG TPA: TolC family protein, partial [Pirellulales bacterium]|nr:TolC family protein [Pirellulales bacterium]
FHDGTTSELDVQQARSSLSQTRSAIPPLKAGLRQASNRLCVLLGVPPHELAGLLKRQPIPVASPQVAVGIPADLLRRRPDIRRAERAVAAQSAQIGVATADLYPRFALNGYLGYAADDLKDLFASKSFTSFIIPTFQWNILNYGRLRNNIRGQEAKLRGKVLDYQQTVLKADREVEDALVAFLQSQEQAKELAESARATQRSVELVVAQYKGGIADFNRVYNTQSLLATQQDQVAQVQGNIATNLIAVYRALGGGWQYFACRSTNGVREGLPATREPLVEAQEEGESVIPKPGDTKPNRSEELVAPKDPHDDSSK